MVSLVLPANVRLPDCFPKFFVAVYTPSIRLHILFFSLVIRIAFLITDTSNQSNLTKDRLFIDCGLSASGKGRAAGYEVPGHAGSGQGAERDGPFLSQSLCRQNPPMCRDGQSFPGGSRLSQDGSED